MCDEAAQAAQEEQDGARVAAMVAWFRANYEDPVESMPFDEGEYVWLVPPRDAREELEDQFPQEDCGLIDKAVAEIENDGFEWVKLEDLKDENWTK